jgi:predicted PurR-regulated permease PerM
MEMSELLGVATMMLSRLPVLIAWVVAVCFAVARWNKHPNVSAMVVFAVAILAIEMIIGSFVSIYVPRRIMAEGGSSTSMSWFFGIYGLVTSVIAAGCWGMLIAAIFGWRHAAVKSP